MTAQDFIQQLEQVFDRQLKPQQSPLYTDKLRRFSSDQLMELLNRVIEEAKYFPKVSEIFKAAQELGYLQTEQAGFHPHRWDKSDCRLCEGEGRLCITWLAMTEIRNEERVEVQALNRILVYSESCDPEHAKLQKGEFRSLFRCSCLAGDAPTIPKSWPKWSKSASAVRYA